MQVWAQWNHPFDMPSAIWGRFLGFSCPEFPLGSVVVSGCSLMAARWQVFFSFLSFLRAHWFTLEGCNQWQLWDLLFTNMVGNIPFLNHIIRSLNVFELRSTLAIRWRRKWQPTSALLPGKPHEQRNLVGYRPWGCKESDMTERLHFCLQKKKMKKQKTKKTKKHSLKLLPVLKVLLLRSWATFRLPDVSALYWLRN